jgi:hypothetical protein
MRVVTVSLALSAVLLGGCTREAPEEPKPERAGEPVSGPEFLARTAVTAGASISGQDDIVRAQQQAVYDDYRRAIKLADPARAVNREQAREVARRIDGVRSVAWVDAANLYVIVERNEQKTEQTIDRICLALEPLGDTLGVVINLQSGEATTGAELQLLVRNCQLAVGEHAFLHDRRDRNVVSDAVWAQHEANQQRGATAENREDEAAKVLEASTPSVHD